MVCIMLSCDKIYRTWPKNLEPWKTIGVVSLEKPDTLSCILFCHFQPRFTELTTAAYSCVEGIPFDFLASAQRDHLIEFHTPRCR